MNGTLEVKEVAEMLNTTEDTIRAYLRTGRLKGFKVKGSHIWHIPIEELERLKKSYQPAS